MKLLDTLLIGTSIIALSSIALVTPASADSLADVQQRGEFKFALTGQYPPFSFIDENGELIGFDVGIGTEISNRLEVKATPVQTAWDGILAGLLADKYDTVIGSMAITEERQKSVDFSDPYYRSGAQLFVANDSEATNIDDMAGKNVGVGLGETYEAWMTENRPDVNLKSYKGLPLIITDLINGRLEGFVTDKIAGTLTLKDKGIEARPVGDLLYPERIGIAIKQDKDELLQAVNQAIADMQSDGTYAEISMKWIGVDIR